MITKSRSGVIVGGVSIVLSSLCLLVMPVLTPAIALALLIGAVGGGFAFAHQARRTAFVAFAFALTPLCGFLAMQYSGGTGYVAFIPWGIALVIAALAFAFYSRKAHAAAHHI